MRLQLPLSKELLGHLVELERDLVVLWLRSKILPELAEALTNCGISEDALLESAKRRKRRGVIEKLTKFSIPSRVCSTGRR